MGRWTSKYQLDILMMLLAQKAGASKTNCRINGDDIIFSDTQVARRFIKLLKYLGVPISDQKTFVKKDFGEFSGLIADATGIYQVQKESPLDVKRDPFGPLRKYGPRGLSLVPRNLRNAVWAVASLPEPYGLESIRKQSGNPYIGFQPVVKSKKFGRISWSQDWVDQAFSEYSMDLLEQRISRVMKHSFRKDISGPDREALGLYARVLAQKLNKVSELALFQGATHHHFSTPLQRLDLLADNFDSYSIKTSDGWKLVGYGDPAFDSLREQATKRFSHSSSKPGDVGWERNPVMPIKWVQNVYKQIIRFISKYY